jgi:maltose O-acetyltransferase
MSVKLWCSLLKRRLLHLLAENSDEFWDPIKPRKQIGYWRRRELTALNVRFGSPICTRPGLFILKHGNLILGHRVAFGHNTRIFNYAPIHIGDDFISATDLIINSGTHDPETLMPSTKKVNIGNRVWCGIRVTILAGVNVGDDVVIGADSLVKYDIPPNSIVAGIPARVIRPLNRKLSPPLWSAFYKSCPQ